MIGAAHITQADMKPYFKDKILEWPDNIIRLHIGEHPFGTSPRVVEQLQKDLHHLHYYPSPSYSALKEKIAQAYPSVKPSNIICGNGSEELLHLVPKALVPPGAEVVMPQFTFKGISLGVLACGGIPVMVPQSIHKSCAYSADDVLACITPQTRMIMIDHPGNPASVFLPEADIRHILAEAQKRDIFALIDGAYDEYALHSEGYVLDDAWVDEFPNTMIVRTFSKAYALAALRLGWMHTSPDVVEAIYRIRLPYHINTLAQKAGIYALEDQDYMKQCAKRIVGIRDDFTKKMTDYELWPSATNFIIARFHNAPSVSAQLKAKGILTRTLEDYDLQHHLKIAMGTEETMESLLLSIQELK